MGSAKFFLVRPENSDGYVTHHISGIFLVKICGTLQGRNPASFEEW